GGLDLSLGSVMGLAGVAGAYVAVNLGWPSVFAVIACILAGAIAGYINGQLVTRAFVPAFIVTLGMLNMAAGAARVVSDNSTITGLPQSFVDFGNLIIGGFLPSIFLVAVLVIAAGWFVLRFTVFGRMIFAVGTNDE
ncbi:ABC transporter permease, partial [Mesorhizobium sp. M8A.F.Ca.ET.182.01.1.1]|uniref:ABC transporter permease n=1 Tax=Mesorhizobium sp. M8A.F.Ca.ET.182.01.1.1 TaxID=2563964 RepID=UPI001138CC08